MESVMKEDQLLKQLARYMFCVMVLLLCFVVALEYRVEQGKDPEEIEKEQLMQEGTEQKELPSPTPTPPQVEAVSQGGHAKEAEVWELWQFLQYASMEELLPKFGERCILIKKPDASCSYEVTEDILRHSFCFCITSETGYLQEAAILRVNEEVFFYGELMEGEVLTELGFLKYEENGEFVTEVSFLPDGYYVPQVTEEDEYYIINLRKYKEVYDKIVVLDAGHGGSDPGAGAENYKIKESQLALKMVLYLKELLEENTEIAVFCTRTEDVKLELAERVELALGVEADLFLSFHCNASEGKTRNGTEVIYNAQQGVEDAFNSEDFARICLNNLVAALGTKSNGIMDRQGLHIVRRATMPIAYLETAYLSNEKDLAILKEEENLKAIAEAVYKSILEAYERMEEEP